MKRRFSSFIGMILVCAVTIAQTSISLLPKPQLYKDTGKNFTMGKVKLSTPVSYTHLTLPTTPYV